MNDTEVNIKMKIVIIQLISSKEKPSEIVVEWLTLIEKISDIKVNTNK
jgi:hypothetical protein